MATLDRRTFLRRTGAVTGGALAASGPFGAFTASALADDRRTSPGYGPLVTRAAKNDPTVTLALPPGFEFVVVQKQGDTMDDGSPVPGIFDGMGAFRPGGSGGDRDDDPKARGRHTILIRNHENRERPGETKVVTGPAFEYDPAATGGNTKVVVDRRAIRRGAPREQIVVSTFAILGGTSSNCAGGQTPWNTWLTCEEVVKRVGGIKHGYVFDIPAGARGPVRAVPNRRMGRFSHEAIAYLDGAFYLTEDRSFGITDRSVSPARTAPDIGASLYRFIPREDPARTPFERLTGRLEALKVVGRPRRNMNLGTNPGDTFEVEWVLIDEPDHDDDSDNRLDRVPGFTPTRVQGFDKGSAQFQRQEGIWEGQRKLYFDCTSGGEAGLGQIWELDPRRSRLRLVFESNDVTQMDGPDNVVIVPQTGDIFAQEDAGDAQFVRGITVDGAIYDFARTTTNQTEFCGGVFDPTGKILYLNQQGNRGSLPSGPPDEAAITYAIFGPFGPDDD